MRRTPVLKLGSFLQKLQAGVGKQDASHHGLQVVLADIIHALLAQDVKQPHDRLTLDMHSSISGREDATCEQTVRMSYAQRRSEGQREKPWHRWKRVKEMCYVQRLPAGICVFATTSRWHRATPRTALGLRAWRRGGMQAQMAARAPAQHANQAEAAGLGLTSGESSLCPAQSAMSLQLAHRAEPSGHASPHLFHFYKTTPGALTMLEPAC